ncbi:hypothetical protein [Microbacterium testaceum]|uniref:hypothetical protein n=1 Tax=Microbacterium testaceum TaxID=2033 RepID=UPI000B2A0286|nr:hypothetical protein [Microbacterium testaceum]
MTVDWTNYKPDWPPFEGPLSSLSRKEAKISFEHFMKERNTRVTELKGLLKRNGIALDFIEGDLQNVNDWFIQNVERCERDPDKLENLWYSVIQDLSAFMGEMIIYRHPNLHWEFFTGRKIDISYQHPVIMGFDNIPKVRMEMNISAPLVTYATRVVRQLPVRPDHFVAIVDQATKLLQIGQKQ